jgi:chaperonin GroES
LKGASNVSKLVPLNDRILIKRKNPLKKTPGGILIPEAAQTKMSEGKVVAVGSGRRLENGKIVPLDVKRGDRVIFWFISGTEIKVEDEELVVVKEDDILCVLG